MIVDARGTVVARADRAGALVVGTLDLDDTVAWRTEFPIRGDHVLAGP